MKEYITFYICAHKLFEEILDNRLNENTVILTDSRCKLYSTNNLKVINEDDYSDNLMNLQLCYSELSRYYTIWKNNLVDTKYVSFEHYRRYFPIDKKTALELLKNYDIILPEPYVFNLYNQYKMCHNIEDLDIFRDIIYSEFPEYKSSCDKVYNQNYLYPCNMFMMSYDHFKEYCEFMFRCFFKFQEIMNIHDMEDIKKYVENNKQKYIVQFDLNYQSRLFGFISERIGNIFYDKFNNKKTIKFIQTNE